MEAGQKSGCHPTKTDPTRESGQNCHIGDVSRLHQTRLYLDTSNRQPVTMASSSIVSWWKTVSVPTCEWLA